MSRFRELLRLRIMLFFNYRGSRGRKGRYLAACIAFVLVGACATASTISTFTSNDEGWTSLGFPNVAGAPDFALTPLNSGVTYNATGGDPGGYVSKQDPDGNWQYFSAPAAFLGDQSGAAGGNLTFEELIITTFGQPALNPQGPLVALTNGTLTLVYGGGGLTPAISGTAWNSLTVPLSAALWKVSTPTGAVATSAQFNSVLSGLTGLFILSDYWTGSASDGEIVGLDNVDLPGLVPEPGTATGCLAGLWIMAGVLRKAKRR